MIRIISIFAFTLIAISGFGQVYFSVSNENPCAGEWITFSVSTLGGCTNPLIPDETSANLTITPTPDYVDYSRYHGSTSIVGITAISVKYNSPHTVSVNAQYNCNGGSIVGNIAKSVVMKPALTTGPTISGLDGNIYSGDPPSTATASIASPPSDITYSWQLQVVSTSRGSITSAAIANPGSATTAINWPSDFVGDVNIIATATSCSTPVSTTKLVSIKYPPDWSWSPNSLPAINCAGNIVGYHLQVFNGFTLVSASALLSGSGNTIPSSEALGSQSTGWSVKWNVDGEVWADFTVTDGSRNWNLTTAHQSFDVVEFDPGQLVDFPSGYACPGTFNLTQSRSPGSSYVYQYCNTGNCGPNSPDWTNNSPATSASFSNISTNTSFRMMLTETRCGNYYSNVVSVAILPALTAGPTISGLDGNIYSGDPASTATAAATSPGAISYSWQLQVVNTVAGSITSAAIASPGSASTAINWPSDFIGDVNIIATATTCTSSASTTKAVTIKYPPQWSWVANNLPAVNCPGKVVSYHLQIFNGFTLVSASAHLGGAGNTIPSNEGLGPQSTGWSVQWNVDGDVWADFRVTDGSRNWDLTTEHKTFDVAEFDAGQLTDIPVGIYCGPMTFNVTLARTPSGSSYVYQFCNTGNCGATSPDWTDNSPSNSAAFTGVSSNTSFRMMLTEKACGTYYSNVVSATVRVMPVITVSDKIIFSGGSFDIPSSDQAGAMVSVTATATSVNGASNASLAQGSSFGTLATQVLTASGPVDGSVVYTITPSNNGCTGQTKSATVTVYKKPQVYSNLASVYKGLTATLSTDTYDSYQWQTSDGTTLATTSTYQTNVPGGYKITVTKSGLVGMSDTFVLGDQFSGVNENYIITRAPQKEFTTIDGLADKTEDEITEVIQYFDGIGRPLQSVNTRMSPSSHDVVQPIAYDQFGREAKKYLPYVSGTDNGRIQPNAIATDQPQFYQGSDPKVASDPNPFAETRFEPSPLNRVVEQGSPGSPWQIGTGHTIAKDYLKNGGSDVLRFTYVSSTGDVILLTAVNAYYTANTLLCNKTIDEQGNDVLEYIDKLGRTICKKVKAPNNAYASTYYVYDDLGNLVVVLPPEGVERILQTN